MDMTTKSRNKLIKQARYFLNEGNNGKYEYTLRNTFEFPHISYSTYWKYSLEFEVSKSIRAVWRNIYRRWFKKPMWGKYIKKEQINGKMRCDTYIAMVYLKSIDKSLAGFKQESTHMYGGYFFPINLWKSLKIYPSNQKHFTTTDCVSYEKKLGNLCVENYINGRPVMKTYTRWEVMTSYNDTITKKKKDDILGHAVCQSHGYNLSLFSY